MTPGQRRAAERRFTRWRSLSDERRQLIRERWAIYRDLSPEEQRRIRENFQRYRELRKERQQMLRERYRNMTPEPAPAGARPAQGSSAPAAVAWQSHQQ